MEVLGRRVINNNKKYGPGWDDFHEIEGVLKNAILYPVHTREMIRNDKSSNRACVFTGLYPARTYGNKNSKPIQCILSFLTSKHDIFCFSFPASCCMVTAIL